MAGEIVGMVGSALVQEGVSGVSSCISSKLDEKASTAHLIEKLEMALSQMEFAFERTREWPITYKSLLRRMKMLKTAYIEGRELLNKHKVRLLEDKLQVLEGQEVGKAVTRKPLLAWFGRAKNLTISSLIAGLNEEYLSASIVERFVWYAENADKFVTDVQSVCPLQRNIFRYPLVKQLLEGKTLRYEMVEGSQTYLLRIIPTRLEERGIEAWLGYRYLDMERPEICFDLVLILRLSEDTDIVGIAIKCLQSLTSQFKLVTKSAIGELTLLPEVQDISHSYAPPLSYSQEKYTEMTKFFRADPICCIDNVVWSHGVPEQVIVISFSCYISDKEYMFHTPTEGVSINLPPLYLKTLFAPHYVSAFPPSIHYSCGGKLEGIIDGSIELMEEIVRTHAINCVVNRPEPTSYDVICRSRHGVALIALSNSCDDPEWPKLTAAPRRGRSSAKSKRQRFV
ncbi:hypothetical protein ACP70R_014572 [Stipagrostis hirtigluma subsp. patula]